jgi:hypothetical protein
MKVGDLVRPTLAASPNWWDIGIIVVYTPRSPHGRDWAYATVLWSDTSQSSEHVKNLEVIYE